MWEEEWGGAQVSTLNSQNRSNGKRGRFRAGDQCDDAREDYYTVRSSLRPIAYPHPGDLLTNSKKTWNHCPSQQKRHAAKKQRPN